MRCSITLVVSLGILLLVGPIFDEGTQLRFFGCGEIACSLAIRLYSVM